MRLQANALAIGQRQQAVVIHNAVQVLHPYGVHIAIKYQVACLILRRKQYMLLAWKYGNRMTSLPCSLHALYVQAGTNSYVIN